MNSERQHSIGATTAETVKPENGVRQIEIETVEVETVEVETLEAWVNDEDVTVIEREGVWICAQSPEHIERAYKYPRYQYVIRQRGATILKETDGRENATAWLEERGIRADEVPEAPERGEEVFRRYYTDQMFREVRHDRRETFESIDPVATTTVVVVGGEVRAKITEEEDGIRSVHFLSKKVDDREIQPVPIRFPR